MTRTTRRSLPALVALALLTAWPTPVVRADHANTRHVLDVDYLKAQYDKGRRLTPIDLRSADEFGRGHLPGARSVPLDELATRFQDIPTLDLVVLYCDCAPADVERAYRFLRGQRYRNLSILDAGFRGWEQRGYPIER